MTPQINSQRFTSCLCFRQIPQDTDGKDWYYYVDKTVTLEQLDELTVEFLAIFNKCPSRLRNRVMQQPGVNAAAIAEKERDKESGNHDAHAASGHRSRTDPSSGGIAKLGNFLINLLITICIASMLRNLFLLLKGNLI